MGNQPPDTSSSTSESDPTQAPVHVDSPNLDSNLNADDDTMEPGTICTICLSDPEQPAYLPCLHRFCSVCLIDYIRGKIVDHGRSGYRTLRNLKIPCPNCRLSCPYLGDIDSWLRDKVIEFGYLTDDPCIEDLIQ